MGALVTDRIRVVFVCLGNICRSPLAEGTFRRHVEQAGLSQRFHIDSAGTAAYHAGEPPDPRSVQEARRQGVDISGQRARKFVASDLSRFDYVMAMDRANLRDIRALAKGPVKAEIGLMLAEGDSRGTEVPDPYYGGARGFSVVWQMVDVATAGLLVRVRTERGL